MTDSPLFTPEDVETLDRVIADYGFGVPFGSSIWLETLRDRLQQWLDQQQVVRKNFDLMPEQYWTDAERATMAALRRSAVSGEIAPVADIDEIDLSEG